MKKGGLAVLLVLTLLVLAFNLPNAMDKVSKEQLPEISKAPVVLELFTSQGCSSCPPADALLERVSERSDVVVIALSYHVDYWNYIGWVDPFSKKDYSIRQSTYNRKFGSRNNYTPQIVVNGREHFVGSDAGKLNQSIASYSGREEVNAIEILNTIRRNDHLEIDYKLGGSLTGKSLRAVLVIDKRTTQVKRGENRNRTLTNSNIVISETEADLDKNQGSIQLMIPELVQDNDKLRAVLLVENLELDIVTAAQSNLFN